MSSVKVNQVQKSPYFLGRLRLAKLFDGNNLRHIWPETISGQCVAQTNHLVCSKLTLLRLKT